LPLAKLAISQDMKDNLIGSATKLALLLIGCTKTDLACRLAKLIMSKGPKLDLHISAISLVPLVNIFLVMEPAQPLAHLITYQKLKMTLISARILAILANIIIKTALAAQPAHQVTASLMGQIISAGNVPLDITIIRTRKLAQQTVLILIQSSLIQTAQ